MAQNLFDAIDPVRLTGYVRAALADLDTNRFFLADALPIRPVADIQAQFNAGGLGLAESATYRTFDAESPIGARPGMSETIIKLPPISQKVRLSEYDRLRMQNVSSDVLVSAVLDDADRLTQNVAARIELARSEALFAGSITLAENGVNATIDFGRTGSHDASAGTVWSTSASAKPISDLLAARDLIRDAGGEPDVIVMNSSVYAEMIATDQVKNLASSNGVNPSIVSDATMSSILTANGLPPVKVYSAKVKVSGSATKIVADDKVIMYDRDGLGDTFSGVTAEQLELDNLRSMEPGIVALATKEWDPVSVWTKAAAIALPVLANPDLSVGLSV